MKKFWKPKTGKPASPDDGELLAFLDGELRPPRQAEIRQLLESDWNLRVRLDELERDVAAYVSATQPPASTDAPTFDDIWRKVETRSTVDQKSEEAPANIQVLWRERMPTWMLQPLPLRIALSLCLALLFTAGLAFWLLRSNQLHKVSAEELVQLATQAEALSLQRVGDPVIYRRIQLKRIGAAESVQWESWKDARPSGQFRQRIADQRGGRMLRELDANQPALLTELETIFRANQFDAERPLSAASFAAWRKQLNQSTDTLTEQKESWRLTTSVAAPRTINTIIAASLLVRKADWHALSLQLKVQGEHETQEYELSELAYDVLPLQALTVFADLAPTPSASATPATAPPLVAATASPSLLPLSSPLPTAAALLEAEVAAFFALHQLQADLGEQIEVLREGNRQVVVRGLVEQAERKQKLIEALRAIPLIAPQILTIEEAARNLKPTLSERVSEATIASEPAVRATPQENVFQQRLEQYFLHRGMDRNRASQQVAALSNTIVAEARGALSEAWALRRLAERFGGGQVAESSPAAQQQLTAIMSDQVTRLKARQRNLQTQLEPLLTSLTVAPSTVMMTSGATPKERALQLFKSVEQFYSLTNSLFAGAGSATGSAESSARQMLAALAQMESTLRHLEP